MRTLLGSDLYNKLNISALIATDLPEPVVPATSTCGILAKSATTGLPAISLPMAMASGECISAYTWLPIISDKNTIWRFGLGISKPMQLLPGMVSTTRMLTTDKARAKSRAKLVIWLPLTPAAGSNSKRVITGPGCADNTLISMPKSINLRSIKRDVKSKVSADGKSTVLLATSNKCNGGRLESKSVANSVVCFSFNTRSLCTISTTGALISTGARSSVRLRSASTNTSRFCTTTLPAFLSCQSMYLVIDQS